MLGWMFLFVFFSSPLYFFRKQVFLFVVASSVHIIGEKTVFCRLCLSRDMVEYFYGSMLGWIFLFSYLICFLFFEVLSTHHGGITVFCRLCLSRDMVEYFYGSMLGWMFIYLFVFFAIPRRALTFCSRFDTR